jgi:hypothetical protein
MRVKSAGVLGDQCTADLGSVLRKAMDRVLVNVTRSFEARRAAMSVSDWELVLSRKAAQLGLMSWFQKVPRLETTRRCQYRSVPGAYRHPGPILREECYEETQLVPEEQCASEPVLPRQLVARWYHCGDRYILDLPADTSLHVNRPLPFGRLVHTWAFRSRFLHRTSVVRGQK